MLDFPINVSIDTPHHPVVMAAQALGAHPDVNALIVVSGRDETARRATEAVLTFNGIPFNRLLLTGHQLWFQVPAVLILMIWFIVMTLHYRRARAPRAY